MVSDRTRIEALLPHRDPFLLVDRIVEEGEGWVLTEWDVPEDLPVFEGHFPGDPVLPGVMISEHGFQSAALAIYAGSDSKEEPGTPVLTRIEDARFKRIVRPGETLTTRAEIVETLANARFCKLTVTCDGATVARIRCTLALAPATAS